MHFPNFLHRLEQNVQLAQDITSDEQATLNHVKGLLRRYEKYRVSMNKVSRLPYTWGNCVAYEA